MDIRDKIAEILAEILFQGQRDGMELGTEDRINSKATDLTPYIDAILAIEVDGKGRLCDAMRLTCPDIQTDDHLCVDCQYSRPATIKDLTRA